MLKVLTLLYFLTPVEDEEDVVVPSTAVVQGRLQNFIEMLNKLDS